MTFIGGKGGHEYEQSVYLHSFPTEITPHPRLYSIGLPRRRWLNSVSVNSEVQEKHLIGEELPLRVGLQDVFVPTPEVPL